MTEEGSVSEKYRDGYDVGDVLEESWGYDQTNIDFYRVVRRTKVTVWLVPLKQRMIEATGPMSETVRPTFEVAEPDWSWDGKPIRRRLKSWDGTVRGLQVNGHGWCSTWDGKPSYQSHYA
jgi:hypothetical protein